MSTIIVVRDAYQVLFSLRSYFFKYSNNFF